MKKILIAAMLTVGLTSAFAQQAGPSGGQTGKQTGVVKGDKKRMAELTAEIYAKLNLTAEQKKKIEDMDKAHAAKVKEARKAGKDDKEGWREKNKALREEHEKGLNAILTTDQQKQYKELRKEAMKKMRKERGVKKETP
ncbi:hypothetical protein EON79_18405 [bacterium]|nr:MAG: hypothetical protein EON79_18405 [bacterium]